MFNFSESATNAYATSIDYNCLPNLYLQDCVPAHQPFPGLATTPSARSGFYRLLDVLELLPKSTLLRICSALALIPSTFGLELDELLRRLLRRTSSGSPGDSPLARAKILRTSVKLTTPDSRPLII